MRLHNDICDRGDTGIERTQRLARARVPQPNVGLVDCAGDALAVRRVGHRFYRPGVPGERQQLFTGGRIPDLNRPVMTGRRQPCAVRRKGQRGHFPVVPDE